MFVDNETIRLTSQGVWLSNGQEITHEQQLAAFARGLGRDPQGYFIRIGRDFKRIEVEDTAYFVLRLEGSASDGFAVVLNDGAIEQLVPETLRYLEGRLTCEVGRSGRQEEARFLRPAYADLLRLLEEERGRHFLRIAGKRYWLD